MIYSTIIIIWNHQSILLYLNEINIICLFSQHIRRPVEKEMAEFEAYFSKTMRSEIPLAEYNSELYLRRKGKQMRPLLVFLTAKLNGKFLNRHLLQQHLLNFFIQLLWFMMMLLMMHMKDEVLFQ